MPTPSTQKKKIVARECRFVQHLPSNIPDDTDDLHIVKEVVYFDDGSSESRLRQIENYQRTFYVTQKAFQDHQDKKEWEKLERLDEHNCTQSGMARAVAKALGQGWKKKVDMRSLSASPYLYGTAISSSALIKQAYKDKWKVKTTPFKYAAFDTETDMVYLDTYNHILMAAVTHKKTAFIAVQKRFVKGLANVQDQVIQKAQEVMGDVVKTRNLQIEVKVCETEWDVIVAAMNKAHEIKPDILGVWNLPFDIKCMIEAAKRAGKRLEDIVSDPAIPEKYRYFDFTEGKAKKVTNAGIVKTFAPHQRWSYVNCAASWTWADPMTSYYYIRLGSQELGSYALDAIAKKEIGYGKLKNHENELTTSKKWHQLMQTQHPIEYICYCINDCVVMEMLDEKIKDMAISLPLFSGCSTFDLFESQPRRTADAIYHFVKSHGMIMGCAGGGLRSDFDEETLSLSGWIVALPSELIRDSGLCLISEDPSIRTNIYICVADLDVTSSYPNGEDALNMSKETTCKELIDVHGVDEEVFRKQNINLTTAPHVNTFEYCQTMMGVGTPKMWVEAFAEEHPDEEIFQARPAGVNFTPNKEMAEA